MDIVSGRVSVLEALALPFCLPISITDRQKGDDVKKQFKETVCEKNAIELPITFSENLKFPKI
ncbi:MAG TPA: hypothetical protein DCQ50_21050 [Chryseobacterium sp.]|nr:hypothetical protein [Chryseobacterium sp.]